MSTEFPFVEIPEHLRPLIGDPDPGTRLFRAYGSDDDIRPWFDAVCEICQGDGAVSPGGVSMYAGVSRPAVHKRLREGRLTGFLFHKVTNGFFFKDKKKLEDGGRPNGYIPVSECKAWAQELSKKPNRMAVLKEAKGDGDWDGDFLNKPPKNWPEKVPKK